ncbi:excinuclease ABC subunit B [Histidinibacterium lentulum]|uniref:Excinuclease ABC subunit B n=1 Tax=Histidinibacterium lentulum TaxID=2480588 RepID=A0A3N2R846_9RHOB|nr:excinuclease ABC subunit B [Histidinibacterium lentulum]ROU03607.1 excinuclease ABC subunit B [Histidinibacterium lentulum]
MIRRALAIAALLAAGPALAWEFTATPVCTLSHEAEGSAWEVTYDPAAELYAIAITLSEGGWPEAEVFSIGFAGGRSLVISTDRHVLSGGGATLTVTDRGFGNVLDGLEFNAAARAFAGDGEALAALDGAAPEVQAFRACVAGGLV